MKPRRTRRRRERLVREERRWRRKGLFRRQRRRTWKLVMGLAFLLALVCAGYMVLATGGDSIAGNLFG